MKEYTIYIKETNLGVIEVKAKNSSDALNKADELYHEGETNWGHTYLDLGITNDELPQKITPKSYYNLKIDGQESNSFAVIKEGDTPAQTADKIRLAISEEYCNEEVQVRDDWEQAFSTADKGGEWHFTAQVGLDEIDFFVSLTTVY